MKSLLCYVKGMCAITAQEIETVGRAFATRTFSLNVGYLAVILRTNCLISSQKQLLTLWSVYISVKRFRLSFCFTRLKLHNFLCAVSTKDKEQCVLPMGTFKIRISLMLEKEKTVTEQQL